MADLGGMDIGGCTKLSAQEAWKIIRSTGDKDADMVCNLMEAAVGNEDLTSEHCLLARYPLFEFFSNRGIPTLPGEVPFKNAPDYVQQNGFPFGFVTRNAFTVVMPSTTSSAKVDNVLAVLGPGATLGLFELLAESSIKDQFVHAVQPWTIQAGTKNVYPVVDVQQTPGRCNGLNLYYEESVDFPTAFKIAPDLGAALSHYDNWKKAIKDWYVEAIFFPRSLLEKTGVHLPVLEQDLSQARLNSYLGNFAAKRLSGTRSYFDGMWHAFRGEASQRNVIRRRQIAFDFWRKLIAGGRGERILYELTKGESDLFPVKETVNFLAVSRTGSRYDNPSSVFVPTSAAQGIRFVPVDELVNQDDAKSVNDMCRQIEVVYKDQSVDNSLLLVDHEAFFDSLRFRLAERKYTGNTSKYVTDEGTQSGALKNVDFEEFIPREQWLVADDQAAKEGGLKLRGNISRLVRVDPALLS